MKLLVCLHSLVIIKSNQDTHISHECSILSQPLKWPLTLLAAGGLHAGHYSGPSSGTSTSLPSFPST